MRAKPDQLAKSLEDPGHPHRYAEASDEGGDGLEQAGPRRLKGTSRSARKMSPPPSQVNGGDKQEGEALERQLQAVVLIVPQGSSAGPDREQAQGGRGAAGGHRAASRQTVCSNRCKMPRYGTIVTRLRRTCRRLFARYSTNSIGQLTAPEVTKQGVEIVALSQEIRPTWTRRKKGKSGTRCLPRSMKRNRKRTCRKSARPQ